MKMTRREMRFVIPQPLLEAFAEEHRIVIDPAPGLWPVDARLIQTGLLEKLIEDEKFNKQFEILIVPR